MQTTEVERIPVHPGNLFFQEHLARYQFSQPRTRPGRILDIACGTGYGTNLFANTHGLSAFGVDLDQSALHTARRTFQTPVLRLCIASGLQLPFPENTFSTIVSLETIEHVIDDRGLLREFARLLTPDGVCMISTPNRLYSLERQITNPYHVLEYVEDELRALLLEAFANVEIYYQGFSDRYHEHVVEYAQSISAGKNRLSAPLRFFVSRVYTPLKPLIPVELRNFLIGRVLHVRYPQPDTADITISERQLPVVSNFFAVCRAPR